MRSEKEDMEEEQKEWDRLEEAIESLSDDHNSICFEYSLDNNDDDGDNRGGGMDITVDAFMEHIDSNTLDMLKDDMHTAVEEALRGYTVSMTGYEICSVSEDRFVIHFHFRATEQVQRDEDDEDPVWDYYARQEEKLEAFEPVDEY